MILASGAARANVIPRSKEEVSLVPRISEITDPGGDPILEAAFEQERQMFGDVLNPTKVVAHCPPVLQALKSLYASFYESGLVPPALHCLVYARVATLNGCPF